MKSQGNQCVQCGKSMGGDFELTEEQREAVAEAARMAATGE